MTGYFEFSRTFIIVSIAQWERLEKNAFYFCYKVSSHQANPTRPGYCINAKSILFVDGLTQVGKLPQVWYQPGLVGKR